jgi:LysM repeat protein
MDLPESGESIMRKSLILFLLLCFSVLASFAQEEESVTLPITEDVNYTVRPADTLDGIGATFDVSPTCLAEMNNITDVRQIFVGTVLLISVSCPRYGEDPRDNVSQEVRIPRDVVTFEDDCTGYRVHRNDSLDLIAFDFDISAVSLALANELEPPYVLEVNQCLTIPEDAPPYGTYPPLQTVDGQPLDEDVGVGGAGTQIVIQPGDTLDEIAQEMDISLQAIMMANGITDASSLAPGTVIFITEDMPAYGVYPALTAEIPGQIYVIGEGDTLESIGQAFDVAVVALSTANDISNNEDLVVGEIIIIPSNAPAFGQDGDFDPSTLLGQGGGGQTYVVQPMDTFDEIAASYNVDTACLLEANGIERPNLVRPGTVVVIDQSCPPYVGEGIPTIEESTEPADTQADG